MGIHDIEDPFVRRFTLTAVHVRRYKVLYAIGMAWMIVLLFVPAVRDSVQDLGNNALAAPASQSAVSTATGAKGAAAGAIRDSVSAGDALTDLVTDQLPGEDSEAVESTGTDLPDVDTGDATTAAGPGLLPDELNPALLAVSPVVGEACNTVGTAALLAALLGPTVPLPVPIGMVTPYMTNVYLACGEIPRLSPRGTCDLDATLPNPIASAGLPIAFAPLGIIFDQLRAIELGAVMAGAPNPGVSGTVGSAIGCQAAIQP